VNTVTKVIHEVPHGKPSPQVDLPPGTLADGNGLVTVNYVFSDDFETDKVTGTV
jgi:hypothetical protein